MAEKRNAGDGFRGWLAIDKPSNVSSANVVNKVKRAFGARKVGHAGTLDRPATGVLAVALGEATKTIQYITGSRKGYRFTVRFGQATETDDFCGKITDTSELRPSDQEIRSTLNEFVGDVMQVPPAYSAVKVAGKRAYKRAVAGETTILNARPLTMHDLRLIRRLDKDRAEFEMVCGKGGYVRAIARDLGMKLGCFGHVAELRRTWSGPFKLEDCIELEVFNGETGAPDLFHLLRPLEVGLESIPRLDCNAEAARRMRVGLPGAVFGEPPDFGATIWASLDGKAVAVGEFRAGELHPSRVFNTP